MGHWSEKRVLNTTPPGIAATHTPAASASTTVVREGQRHRQAPDSAGQAPAANRAAAGTPIHPWNHVPGRLPERLAAAASLLPGLAHGPGSSGSVAGTCCTQLGGAAVDVVRHRFDRAAARLRSAHAAGGAAGLRRPGFLHRHGRGRDGVGRGGARYRAHAPRQTRPGLGRAARTEQTPQLWATVAELDAPGALLSRPVVDGRAAALSSDGHAPRRARPGVGPADRPE